MNNKYLSIVQVGCLMCLRRMWSSTKRPGLHRPAVFLLPGLGLGLAWPESVLCCGPTNEHRKMAELAGQARPARCGGAETTNKTTVEAIVCSRDTTFTPPFTDAVRKQTTKTSTSKRPKTATPLMRSGPTDSAGENLSQGQGARRTWLVKR